MNSNWSLNLQFHLQYTPFKWNCLTHQKHIHQVSTFNHVIVHCTYVAPLDCCLSIEVESEQEATPLVEDPDTDPPNKGNRPPPLIMSIKTQFPLILLCMIGMVTLYRF